jgi:protein O-GlcNAc transferase
MTPGCVDMQYLHNFQSYIDADIVHLHCIQGGYFDWRILPQISREKKVIMTLHDDWIVSGNDERNLFHPYKTHSQYLKRKEVFQNCNIQYIGVSDWITKKIQKDAILWNNTVQTIYNGIDSRIFFPKEKKESRMRLGLPFEKKIIISIAGSGGKSNAKWLQYVNEIVKRYKNNPDYMFVTLGNFSSRKISENLLEVGYVSSDLVAEYFSAADLFLYPTIMDSFGLVIAESLACGCPVVTFDTGWTSEIVRQGIDGYVAQHKDYEDLVRWFDIWIEKNQRPKIQLDTKFSLENMLKHYIELYQNWF